MHMGKNTLGQVIFWMYHQLQLNTFTARRKFTKPVDFTIPNCQMKPKCVTTQMKALAEYILMVLFVLLLKTVHFHAILCVIWMKDIAVKGINRRYFQTYNMRRIEPALKEASALAGPPPGTPCRQPLEELNTIVY